MKPQLGKNYITSTVGFYLTSSSPPRVSLGTASTRFLYSPNALPVAQPTVSKHWRRRETKEGRSSMHNHIL